MTCLALSARSAFSIPVIGTAALPLLLLVSGRHLRAQTAGRRGLRKVGTEEHLRDIDVRIELSEAR